MTHGPIQKQYHKQMNDVAKTLDAVFNGDQRPRPVGFVLLTFEFGKMEGGRVNYISNGARDEIRVALKELLARWEGQADVPETPQ